MIVLYTLLETHQNRLINLLITQIHKEIPAYARISRHELRESIQYFLESFWDFLISGDNANLKTYFRYVTRLRSSQSFELSVIVRAQLCFSAVVRTILQNEIRRQPGDGQATFNQSAQKLDRTFHDAIALFIEVHREFLQSRIDTHNQYLQEQKQRHGIDLSKFILFRA